MKISSKIRFLIIICFVCALGTPSSAAEESLWDGHTKPALRKGFDRSGLLLIAGGLAAVAGTQPLDYENRANWNRNQKISPATTKFGDLLGTGIPGGLIALTQLKFDHDNGFAHAEAMIYTGIATAALKQACSRARPDSQNHHSMPSGHTSTTFASATALTYAYGWKAAIIGYPLAVFTAATRWSDDAHWLSDTVGGAFLGIFWARAVGGHHDENPSEQQSAVLPQILPGGAGLTYLVAF